MNPTMRGVSCLGCVRLQPVFKLVPFPLRALGIGSETSDSTTESKSLRRTFMFRSKSDRPTCNAFLSQLDRCNVSPQPPILAIIRYALYYFRSVEYRPQKPSSNYGFLVPFESLHLTRKLFVFVGSRRLRFRQRCCLLTWRCVETDLAAVVVPGIDGPLGARQTVRGTFAVSAHSRCLRRDVVASRCCSHLLHFDSTPSFGVRCASDVPFCTSLSKCIRR